MKVIAFFLPQFHRTPENDTWWGEGFTEWTNTAKAQPLYTGHYQPRIPLGHNYYDLSDPAIRLWQAELAERFGIYGFCYYHYWFKGKRLLSKPLDGVLASNQPDFPFCLSWANESWTRRWDGKKHHILMEQDYGDAKDWREHFNFLSNVFKDTRYIRIDNKPLFIIYRPSLIPRCGEMLRYWNTEAKRVGWDGIHFVKTLTIFDKKNDSSDFDSQIEFEPMYTIGHFLGTPKKILRYVKRMIRRGLLSRRMHVPEIFLNRLSYDRIWKTILSRRRETGVKTYLGAFTDWDNTPRRKEDALIIAGAKPEKFERYMGQQINNAKKMKSDFLFINAWNEWAEGAYLEPDLRYGHQYLDALYRALTDCRSK